MTWVRKFLFFSRLLEIALACLATQNNRDIVLESLFYKKFNFNFKPKREKILRNMKFPSTFIILAFLSADAIIFSTFALPVSQF